MVSHFSQELQISGIFDLLTTRWIVSRVFLWHHNQMDRERGHQYTAYFCEENIWHLGHDLCPPRNPEDFLTLILAGRECVIPLFSQKKGHPGRPTWWDYHVILWDTRENLIFDFDSVLPFPCPLETYFKATFSLCSLFPENFQPMIRAIPLKEFLRRFFSDRSHMLNSRNQPRTPFPPWPPILNAENSLKLQDLRDVEKPLEDTSTPGLWTKFFKPPTWPRPFPLPSSSVPSISDGE